MEIVPADDLAQPIARAEHEAMSASPPPPSDAAQSLRARLRADLKTAMQARATARIAVLRILIAAVDNAQAVPPEDRHDRYRPVAFGDRSAEAPRAMLSAEAIERLLERDVAERLQAAGEFDRLSRPERAETLRAEAALIGTYSLGFSALGEVLKQLESTCVEEKPTPPPLDAARSAVQRAMDEIATRRAA